MRRSRPFLPRPSIASGATDFLWATGIEDTFIAQPDARTGRVLDEYALTGHYDRWPQDLALIESLGVSSARYGIPWYRVEPEPGRFDWAWTDSVLETLVNTHGIEPIIDLMHYGTPLWLEGSFLSPDYPARVAAYARAFAERYHDLCAWYTPLNEPRVNAWFAARLGWWPPYKRSWKGFAQVLVALAKGIVLTQQAIAEVQPEAIFVHVDATDLYVTADASLVEETTLRQAIVFCALDLVQGRINEAHPLHSWLRQHGVETEAIDWFQTHHVAPDIVGYNMYPMFSEKHLRRTDGDAFAVKITPCWDEAFARLTRMYADRYGLPVVCTETASAGPPARRVRWIADSVRQVNRLRTEGVPLVGYTYWPLFSLVAWGWKQSALPLERFWVDMGLWNIDRKEGAGYLERVPTSAVDAYRQAVAAPVAPLP